MFGPAAWLHPGCIHLQGMSDSFFGLDQQLDLSITTAEPEAVWAPDGLGMTKFSPKYGLYSYPKKCQKEADDKYRWCIDVLLMFSNLGICVQNVYISYILYIIIYNLYIIYIYCIDIFNYIYIYVIYIYTHMLYIYIHIISTLLTKF